MIISQKTNRNFSKVEYKLYTIYDFEQKTK